MAIASVEQLVAAKKQRIRITKTASVTAVAAQWTSLWDVAGVPGAGSLTVGNTASGLVPSTVTAGAPAIDAYGGSATGYLARVGYSGSVASTMCLYDRIFHAGSYALTALGTTALSAQPSYLARTVDGAGGNLEIWLEINVTVSATATTVAVGYTSSDGTTGRTTPVSPSLSGYLSRRLVQLPLQAGDRGVQRIDSVIVGGTVATAGSVNVVVARSLAEHVRVKSANDGGNLGWGDTMMPVVPQTAALWLAVAPDSTATGIPSMTAVIANG